MLKINVRARLIRNRRRFSEPHTNAPAAASALPQVCTVASTRSESPACATQSAALRSAHSNGVRFVNDQFGAVEIGERGQIGQRRAVALHAEKAFDHDHARPGQAFGAPQFIFQEIQIEMRKNDALAFGQANSVNEAGMVGAVRENNVLSRRMAVSSPVFAA